MPEEQDLLHCLVIDYFRSMVFQYLFNFIFIIDEYWIEMCETEKQAVKLEWLQFIMCLEHDQYLERIF